MKFILLLCISLLTFNTSLAQSDSVTFSNERVLKISNRITDLEQKDSINEVIIEKYKTQVSYHNALHITDSLLLNFKNQELKLTEHKVDLYKDLAILNKPKWYERRQISFISGIGVMLGASWLLSNIQ